jgi:hypothetical protein
LKKRTKKLLSVKVRFSAKSVAESENFDFVMVVAQQPPRGLPATSLAIERYGSSQNHREVWMTR